MATFEQHVRARTCTREEIDHFLDPEKLSWGQFDPEVGYILGNYLPQDGVDNSSTINTVQKKRSPRCIPVRRSVPPHQHLWQQFHPRCTSK